MSVYNLKETSQDYLNHLQYLKSKEDQEQIKAVAKEMESLFIYELIKTMRKTITEFSKNSLGGDIYMTIFDLEIARLCSETGIGIKDMITRKLLKKTYAHRLTEISERNSDFNIMKKDIMRNEVLHQTYNGTLPVNGKVSSNYGLRIHPIFGDIRFHYGIDISAPLGTPIYPIRSGRVIFSGQKSGYGNIVIIDHGDGLISKYAHNLSNFVREGDEVDTNTKIAEVGSSGDSTDAHLHFEIELNGMNVDPLNFIKLT